MRQQRKSCHGISKQNNSHGKCKHGSEKVLALDVFVTDNSENKAERDGEYNCHGCIFKGYHQAVYKCRGSKNRDIVAKAYIGRHLPQRCRHGKAQTNRLKKRPE